MDKTIYKLPDIEKIVKEQKYRFVTLLNLEGETIVPYNTIKGGAGAVTKKLSEIATRCKRLSPGVYCIVCKHVYGPNVSSDKYYLGVGKYDPLTLNDAPAMPDKKQRNQEEPKSKSAEHLLSISEAMANMRELAELKGENARLKSENEKLKEEIADLEDELEEEEEDEGGISEMGTGLKDVFKEFLPALEPIADRFMALKEKELEFKKAKYLADKGYDIGIPKKNGRVARSKQNQEQREVPEPGGNGWEQYIETLCAMEDGPLEEHLAQLQKLQPETYAAVCEEIYEEEEEETEENE